MYKNFFLLPTFFLITSLLFAQNKQSEIIKRISYKSFFIEIIKEDNGSFGYNLNTTGGRILEQLKRPYSKSKIGFVNAENASLMAKAHVDILKKGKDISEFKIDDAKSTGISSDDL